MCNHLKEINIFAVIIKRPYYPDISYFDNENDARESFKKMVAEEHDEDGCHKSNVCLCKVLEKHEILTDY